MGAREKDRVVGGVWLVKRKWGTAGEEAEGSARSCGEASPPPLCGTTTGCTLRHLCFILVCVCVCVSFTLTL